MRQYLPETGGKWTLTDTTAVYDRQTIFDYIDGAGEVYLSYDYRNASVFRYNNPDGPEITVEIFDMGKPDDAYGVFSHNRESEEQGIGQGYEYRGSVLCFWQNKYFVCVTAANETELSKLAVFAIARGIATKLPAGGTMPVMISFLPQNNLNWATIRFFHTHPSLSYHYFLSEQNILNLGQYTDVVLAHYDSTGAYLLCVKYPDDILSDKAYASFIAGYVPEAEMVGAAETAKDKWVAVQTVGKYVVIALDSPTELAARNLVNATEDNILKATR